MSKQIKKKENPEVFKRWFAEIENCHYLEHEAIELFGYKIFGTPYIPPVGHWAFMRNEDDRKVLFS